MARPGAYHAAVFNRRAARISKTLSAHVSVGRKWVIPPRGRADQSGDLFKVTDMNTIVSLFELNFVPINYNKTKYAVFRYNISFNFIIN